jgi:hypothetical protein
MSEYSNRSKRIAEAVVARLRGVKESAEQIDEISIDTMKSAKAGLAAKAIDYHMNDNKHWARQYAHRALNMGKKIAQKERMAKEETEADQLDTSLSDIVPGKEGEIYKKTSEKSTAPSKPTGTTTHVVAGKTGEAYNTTAITKRVPALESAIADVMAESFRNRALYEEAANISIVTPEQRQDWMNVEMGKLNFMDYLDKYKV